MISEYRSSGNNKTLKFNGKYKRAIKRKSNLTLMFIPLNSLARSYREIQQQLRLTWD